MIRIKMGGPVIKTLMTILFIAFLSIMLCFGVAVGEETPAIYDCKDVIQVSPDTKEFRWVITSLEKDLMKVDPDTRVTDVGFVNRKGSWYMVDAGSNNSEGALMLLYRGQKRIRLISSFGGDWEPLDRIVSTMSNVFVSDAPKAPRDLIWCSVTKLTGFTNDKPGRTRLVGVESAKDISIRQEE